MCERLMPFYRYRQSNDQNDQNAKKCQRTVIRESGSNNRTVAGFMSHYLCVGEFQRKDERRMPELDVALGFTPFCIVYTIQ